MIDNQNFYLESMRAAHSPAYIYNEKMIQENCKYFYERCVSKKVEQYFPIKCHNIYSSLKVIKNYVNGFAVSSLFEAKIAREILGPTKKIHFTSPGLRDDELDEVLNLCDGIAFNSISQWNRCREKAISQVSCGLRVNTQLSFVEDNRYNPCKPQSRLGIPLDKLKQAFASNPVAFGAIGGIHFHTNCDSKEWNPLLKTVRHIDSQIPDLLRQCRWINLGGGYLLNNSTNLTPLYEAVELLQSKYGLEVIIEPGAAVVRDACVLVAQVIDLFESDGKQIAVLDTTVNHMPEVFEYQSSPDVIGDTEDGNFCYILAGSTCLAGDVFGEYGFEAPLEVGSRITFSGMGAYTLVKAHMFNGVNLPSVYALTASGSLELKREYTYQDFKNRCGAETTNESIRKTAKSNSSSKQQKSA